MYYLCSENKGADQLCSYVSYWPDQNVIFQNFYLKQSDQQYLFIKGQAARSKKSHYSS